MKVTNVKAIYFSGTGTTAKAVSVLGTALAQAFEVPFDPICINPPSMRTATLHFRETELVIIASPTYAGRIPNLLLPYYQNKLKGNQTMAIPLCLYGNRSVDDALIELRNTLQENQFHCIGAAAVVGQHVFAPALGRHRPSQGDFIQLRRLATSLYQKIDSLDALPDLPIEVPGNDPVGPYYMPKDRYGYPINILKVRPKTRKDKCNNCGICIRTCPVSAISPDPNQIPGPCMKCGSCLKLCPTKAKYYEDDGFLFHKEELEAQFQAPKQTEIFF